MFVCFSQRTAARHNQQPTLALIPCPLLLHLCVTILTVVVDTNPLQMRKATLCILSDPQRVLHFFIDRHCLATNGLYPVHPTLSLKVPNVLRCFVEMSWTRYLGVYHQRRRSVMHLHNWIHHQYHFINHLMTQIFWQMTTTQATIGNTWILHCQSQLTKPHHDGYTLLIKNGPLLCWSCWMIWMLPIMHSHLSCDGPEVLQRPAIPFTLTVD